MIRIVTIQEDKRRVLSKEEKKKRKLCYIAIRPERLSNCDYFQLDSLDVRCDGGLEAPEGRLLEVFVCKLTKCFRKMQEHHVPFN